MASSPADSVSSNHQDDPREDEDANNKDVNGEQAEEERQFYEPSHIWYASTVFPLSAACFGPLASALNICALVEDWRLFIPPGADEAGEALIADPRW
jgi:potassium channel subfamily K